MDVPGLRRLSRNGKARGRRSTSILGEDVEGGVGGLDEEAA